MDSFSTSDESKYNVVGNANNIWILISKIKTLNDGRISFINTIIVNFVMKLKNFAKVVYF